jgi:hypothetical protein
MRKRKMMNELRRDIMNLDFTDHAILKGAADAIRTHNYIHNRAERNAVLITEYLNFAADLIDGLANGNVIVVRHGRWIFGSSKTSCWMKCSVCCKAQNGQTATFSYCPNCGAKMDETDTNNDKGETIL